MLVVPEVGPCGASFAGVSFAELGFSMYDGAMMDYEMEGAVVNLAMCL